MNDTELDELERFEALVRGPGWTPDINKGADYEEWTGKWYTPPRPDGTGGCSLALYADDEEILYAKYIAAQRRPPPHPSGAPSGRIRQGRPGCRERGAPPQALRGRTRARGATGARRGGHRNCNGGNGLGAQVP